MHQLPPHFPKYARRRELFIKVHLTAEEVKESNQIERELDLFRKEHPDWRADGEGLRVPLGELAKRK